MKFQSVTVRKQKLLPLRVAITVSVIALLILTIATPLTQKTQVEAQAQNPFTTNLYEDGLTVPTSMTFSPDGRLFVTEKAGTVRIIKDGTLLQEPFLTLNVSSNSERGLLSIAFDPEFDTNRYVYVYYTRATEPIKNRVSRFTVQLANPNKVEQGSEKILVDEIPSDLGIHNAGAVNFGKDGKLYIATGDAGANSNNSQNLSILAGKILRINKDGTIPIDNPFVGNPERKGEIWAYGLRNPFTFSFNPETGVMYINDVGKDAWEEINQGQKGANYGWPLCEGGCSNSAFVNPIYQYGHATGRAITGGAFYTGSTFPQEYQGDYFFADYVSNWIKRYDPSTKQASDFIANAETPVDLDVGPDGALYYLSINNGTVSRIASTSTPSITPSATPKPTSTPTAAPTQKPNQSPSATILTPTASTKYQAGKTITFTAQATDPEDGALDGEQLKWSVVFHHGTHTHPFLDSFATGKTGSFAIPDQGESSSDVWYRLYLRAKDSQGLETAVYRDILPEKADFVVETLPQGLEISVDGQPKLTPYTETSVVGFKRQIDTVSPQNGKDKQYTFASWSDGQAKAHTYTVKSGQNKITATFIEKTPTPTASPTPTKTPEVTPKPTASPTPKPTSTATPTPTPTPSPTPSVTQAPLPTTEPTPKPTPEETPFPLDHSILHIYAAGQPADDVYPDMAVMIDGEVTAVFSDIQGDYKNENYNEYIYVHEGRMTIDEVKLQFINDHYTDPSNDRNLRIDKVVLDDKEYQTEESTTFSTGTWTAQDGCAPGNKQSEWLMCNGYVAYDKENTSPTPSPEPQEHSLVEIFAAGTQADGIYPTLELLVKDEVVRTFEDVSGNPKEREFIKYKYEASEKIAPEDIKVKFINDTMTSHSNDRNVRVDKIVIDGVEYESEDPTTYSTGTWRRADSCGPGNKASEWLDCNGYFLYHR